MPDKVRKVDPTPDDESQTTSLTQWLLVLQLWISACLLIMAVCQTLIFLLVPIFHGAAGILFVITCPLVLVFGIYATSHAISGIPRHISGIPKLLFMGFNLVFWALWLKWHNLLF
jgi:hypothetical protein